MPDESVKPIIFLAFANDRDNRARYLRNLAEEARRLREALAPAERAGLCQVVVRQNATVREIFDVFQDAQTRNRVAAFHYGGHADSYRLLSQGQRRPGGDRKFATRFCTGPGKRCVHRHGLRRSAGGPAHRQGGFARHFGAIEKGLRVRNPRGEGRQQARGTHHLAPARNSPSGGQPAHDGQRRMGKRIVYEHQER